MKRLLLAAAVVAAINAAPASAQTFRTFRCSNSTVLRVIFDEEHGIATVVPFGRPSIRLQRAHSNGSVFRYVRRDSHELSGNLQEVHWRAGHADWTCRH
ncbi:MAG: hypothetical protein KF779_18715 [Hyphomonadaceae bacterium]|nr:hypothetical protein [Hyphomonadaceae bacterium]